MSSPTPVESPGAIVPEDFVFPGTEDIDYFSVFADAGYTAPRRGTDGAAQAALICGLLSFIPFLGLVAAGLGYWGLLRLRKSYDTGLSFAWAGIVLGIATSVIWLWGTLVYQIINRIV